MNNIKKYNCKLNVLGSIIKSHRKEIGWSLVELSNQLMLIGIDIPKSSLIRLEAGKRIIKDYELAGLSKVLNISPNDLLKSFIDELNQ